MDKRQKIVFISFLVLMALNMILIWVLPVFYAGHIAVPASAAIFIIFSFIFP